jgi:acyl-coenzyme A synthetase/AMP-(fatty) acid ligase
VASSKEDSAIHTSRELQWATPDVLDSIAAGLYSTEPPLEPATKQTEQDVAYIHHTSGTSSGLPKPIPQTHRAAIGVLPSLDGHNEAAFTTTPLYHGGVADCFRAWTSKAMIWLYPATELPITSVNIQKCLSHAANCRKSSQWIPEIKYFSSVPYVLQMLDSEDALSWLRKMDIVGVGGAALPPTTGDSLVKEGVNLISRFGSAECGFTLSSHRHYATDKEWQYLRSPSNSNLLKFEHHDDSSLAELIIQDGWPHMAKKNRPDGSFTTSDLFEGHDKIANAWKYHSRSDSQITLITGKKFDPAPLEDTLRDSSPMIQDVLIFGNEKQFPGVLVFPTEKKAPSDLEDFANKVWDLLQSMNKEGQEHTRISQSMIVVMQPPDPPLHKSSKGTIMRGVVEKRFKEHIEGAYGGGPESNSEESLLPEANVQKELRRIVDGVVGGDANLEPHADFYLSGVDSVKATRIRALIQMVSRPLALRMIADFWLRTENFSLRD